jgi:predicted HAD superfamily Cof-like phosphohydrolase
VDKEVQRVWATAVVAAFLAKRFPDQKTNWDLVVKKALKFIARAKKEVKVKDASDELDWFQLATAFLG